MLQCLHEGLIRDQCLLGGAPEEYGRPVRMDSARELACQAGLADTGLARQEHHAALARSDAIPRALQARQLVRPAYKGNSLARREPRWQRDAGRLSGRPQHLGGRQRLRQALQGQRAETLEGVDAPTLDQAAYQTGCDDLSSPRPLAQTYRDDDRLPVVIVFIAKRLPDVNADAHLQIVLLALVLPVHGALDRDRAGDGIDGAREGDHQAVAAVLDLAPAVRRHRVAQQGEMHASRPLCGLVTETVEMGGRPDNVGDQHRDDARLRHDAAPHAAL